MEGFILAAGLGTRLRPLTNDRPKALVEVGGVTLLERTIRRLEEAGVEHIVVNVHHFADQVIDFVGSHRWQAEVEISDERDLLLDTGGGLKRAARLFRGSDDILIHNVDVLSDIDLRAVEAQHRSEGNLATLCVSRRDTKRLLEFDDNGLLLNRADSSHLPDAHEDKPLPSHLAFSGIAVVSPELPSLLPEADQPYPIVDQYIALAHQGRRIGSYLHCAEQWLDVGKPETLALAESRFKL